MLVEKKIEQFVGKDQEQPQKRAPTYILVFYCLVKRACFNTTYQVKLSLKGLIKVIHPSPGLPWRAESHSPLPPLTFSPEAQAPLCRGDLAVLVAVAGVEERPDADLILVQVNGRQLAVLQIQISVGVELGKHPADGILAAGDEAPVQHCPETISIISLSVCLGEEEETTRRLCA